MSIFTCYLQIIVDANDIQITERIKCHEQPPKAGVYFWTMNKMCKELLNADNKSYFISEKLSD